MLNYLLYRVVRDGNILPVTSVCNLRCVFCSNAQNPAGVEYYSVPHLPVARIRRLIGYLDPHRKIIIGEAASRITEGEPFTHPGIWTVLEEIRERYPAAPIQITTNGTRLDAGVIGRLLELRPLEINLSLNSATPGGRWLLMRDRRPERVLAAADLMAEAGLTYHGSLVALPHLTGWDDLRESVRFLQRHNAATIRVFLPGYTRLAPSFLRFDPAELHQRLHEVIESLAAGSRTPLWVEPPYPGAVAAAPGEIAGVIEASPADLAGLTRGQVISGINGRPVRSNPEAHRWLSRLSHPVLSLGSGAQVKFRKPRKGPSGIVLYSGPDEEQVCRVERVIRESGARAVLALTSAWGYSQLAQVKSRWEQSSSRITLAVAANRYFGGSISCAGLLTCGDLSWAIREEREKAGGDFDLVLLPGIAFDHRGRDLLGRHYSRLQRVTSGRVVVI